MLAPNPTTNRLQIHECVLAAADALCAARLGQGCTAAAEAGIAVAADGAHGPIAEDSGGSPLQRLLDAAGKEEEEASRRLEACVAQFTAALHRHQAPTGPAAHHRPSSCSRGASRGGGDAPGGGDHSGSSSSSDVFGGAVLPRKDCSECCQWVSDGRKPPSCSDQTFFRFNVWALMARCGPPCCFAAVGVVSPAGFRKAPCAGMS